MTYTGDVLLQFEAGDIDALWEDGQPRMTDGFETSVLMAIFGDRDTWQNAITDSQDERYVSTFPDVIANATVSDATKKDGIAALERALSFLKSSGAASGVSVTGRIASVFTIAWSIEIHSPTRGTTRYEINWERGVVTMMNNGGTA
jgi:hypothetical protein